MKLPITSNVGAGPIKLGMKRPDVHKARAPSKAVLRESFVLKLPVDFFPSLGVKINYGSGKHCEAIELAKPAVPLLDGKTILGKTSKDVLSWLKEKDPDVRLDADGLRSTKLGVGMYVPNARRRPTAKVEGVIVFVHGYYEKYAQALA